MENENNVMQGDWQAPVGQGAKKNKSIIIAVATLVVIVAIVVFAVMQNKKEEVVDVPVKKTYTTEEKIKILQNLSSARAAQQSGGAGSTLNADGTPKPVAQVTKERTQILQNLSASAPRSTLSDEEKLKILQSLNR